MPSVDITEDFVVDTIGAFIHGVIGNDVPIVRGQDNLVPAPVGPNYIVITPSSRQRLSTNQDKYDGTAGTRTIRRGILATFQIDFYGPDSADLTEAVTMVFRDMDGCDAMAGTGVQPLYCGDGRQMPLVNGEKQYEDRWTFYMNVQFNPSISTSVEFADSVEPTLVEADQ